MKSFIYHFVFIVCISAVANSQTTKKVLFIGNSYTDVNNLPAMVSNAAASTGDVLIYDSNLPGGSRFINHASNPTTLNKINSNTWDYVVLQAQSQETSLNESQMVAEVYPYATSLSNAIRANNECSQPLFYMTWGKENGDAGNCPYLPWVCTYAGMDDKIRETYITMAQQNNAELAPVGAVWRYLRTNHPSIGLYSSDSSHPSLAGSYAAACAFYAVIYKKDPTSITWNSTLTEAQATTIKLATKTIVFDNLDSWDFTENAANAIFSEVITGAEVSFTNESAPFDSLLWTFGDETTSTEDNPIHVYPANGVYMVSLTTIKCGKSSTITKTVQINSDLGVGPFNAGNITLYPNPIAGEVSVKLNKTYKSIDVVVVDVLGNIILKNSFKDSSSVSFDTGHLSSGTYFVKVVADDAIFTSKILKI